MSINVDAREIEKFGRLAEHWWDISGEMETLHIINPVRVGYIERAAGALRGKTVLDVGCGGGILSEALAHAGAHTLGIDLAEPSIEVAREHAEAGGLTTAPQALSYRAISAEALAEEQPGSFDLVCCMEMLEHVPDPARTIAACAKLVKPGGTLVFSTINRTPKSYALMIVGAEYVLNLVPRGTHEYAKFIRPSELQRWARNAGLDCVDITGMRYDPVFKRASLGRDVDVNYLMHCVRPA